MKIKVGDLLMNDLLQLGMVEGIGFLASGYTQYWVHWCADNWEHWVSEGTTIIYRNTYLSFRE